MRPMMSRADSNQLDMSHLDETVQLNPSEPCQIDKIKDEGNQIEWTELKTRGKKWSAVWKSLKLKCDESYQILHISALKCLLLLWNTYSSVDGLIS